jgi:predicted nucleic acid-binding protein
MQLARENNHPIYDCFYLALARQEAATLVTMDRRLGEIADRIGIRSELLVSRR